MSNRRTPCPFHDAYQTAVRRLCAAGESIHDAQDIAQTAVTEAYARRETIFDPKMTTAYVWTIAKRTMWRRWNSSTIPLSPDDATWESADETAKVVDVVIVGDEVRGILESLSDRDRDLLWSHHALEESCADIAARYGLSPSSMPRLLARARERARRTREQDGDRSGVVHDSVRRAPLRNPGRFTSSPAVDVARFSGKRWSST